MPVEKLKSILARSQNIVFFGGAGISTESGIPDFRSGTGLYNAQGGPAYPPEVILSHSFFMEHTQEFYRYYKSKLIYKDAKPNAAHLALAELERRGKLKAVVTQNIDALHQLAGSRNVLELHGSILRNFCMKCRKSFDLDYVVHSPEIVPKCDACSGVVKPDVVLYEEMLDMHVLNKAVGCISRAEVLIIAGTSLVVHPAAGLIEYYHGNNLILINNSPTPYDGRANLIIQDSVGRVLGSIV